MKKLLIIFTILLTIPAHAFNLHVEIRNDVDSCESLKHTDTTELSVDEVNGLIHMKYEEKLARDVYTALGEIWNVRIFNKIKQSEQRHMDAVKRILDFYNISDPSEKDEPGTFSSSDFQKLYDDLVEKGSKSYQEAIRVGVIIEELDISDLKDQLELVNHKDIRVVYENLKSASERHLFAFNRHINKK